MLSSPTNSTSIIDYRSIANDIMEFLRTFEEVEIHHIAKVLHEGVSEVSR